MAGLQARWGAAAPRTLGALALTPETAPAPSPVSEPLPGDRVVRTGFDALDAILGPGGLPTSASVAIRGDGSSGRTTLALRTVAEAQTGGAVVAWLDLSRSLDPVEAVSRGVLLDWLVVITPESLDEGLRIAGALLAGRAVDLLVLDLPGGRLARTDTPAKVADRLHRLAALARRAETLLLVLDGPVTGGGLATAVDQATGIRLELARRSWIRLGRDVVGQRTEVHVAHDRHGPAGRRATLRILYAEGGERDACLARDPLLVDHAPAAEAPDREMDHATPARLRAASLPGPGGGPTLRALPGRSARPGRSSVGSGPGHRREPGRASARRAPGHPARERPPTRP